ncbi:hypothetical protein QP547_04955 [Weeksella virosa]|uniref:hypothetical protein n=1 Tax=Weeksella virosa TaxID=1014 RepID=UPI0025546178|nr:hypothetical protein [Weeksella virosa]MDK7675157.1 hypothetical protein [Weeksella virosa]
MKKTLLTLFAIASFFIGNAQDNQKFAPNVYKSTTTDKTFVVKFIIRNRKRQVNIKIHQKIINFQPANAGFI